MLKSIILIIFVGTLVRIGLIGTPFWRTPDAIEYISVARNINAGLGLTQTVKSNFINNTPVISSAISGRPIFLPIILSGILRITNNLYSLQLFSLAIGILNGLLIFLITKKFTSQLVATIGGLLAVLNPNILINGRLILSEPVFATFLLLGILVWKKWWLLSGIFWGLAYLTRQEGLLLLLIGLPGFIVLAFPYWIQNYLINGNPLFTYNTVHYQMKSFLDFINSGYGSVLPSAFDFIKNNYSWIFLKVLENILLNIKSIIGFSYLGFLSIFLIKWQKKFWPIYFFSVFTVLLYASMWSAIFERERHFIPIYLLLLIPILYFIDKHRKNLIVWILVFITFASYVAFDIHRIVWARSIDPVVDVWSKSDRSEIYSWIKNNTNILDIISSTNPLMVNLWTERPGIITPREIINDGVYFKYINQFKIRWFLVDEEKYFDFYDSNANLVKVFNNGQRVYETKY